MGFSAVEQQPDFGALEERVLERWRQRRVFERSLEIRDGAPLFSFYEGPPTANGRPGVHHVEARVFKDVFPRYRTMKGYRVPRKGGWDCHGIPVELEVERELGFDRKQDIEDFGVAEFNARCRESVKRYVGEFERLTERIGFWVDTEDAYWTMNTPYVESVWWSLAKLWDEGLIYEGHRVVPYCPRCGTALSDHEVAQGYAQTVDPSVFVRFPVVEGGLAYAGASLLVWTTTPWTLISNTAVAVGPDIRYVLAQAAGDDYPVVMAAELVEGVLGPDATVHRDVPLEELRGLHYRAPFAELSLRAPGDDADWRYVAVADFVTTTDGTGIVHMAPAFGADDMALAREYGLPVVNPVDTEGRFDDRVPHFAGQFVKDADEHIIAALRARGLLFSSGTYSHTYPFCWRCKTPLLYYAKPSWYIATTQIRDRLTAANAKVDWHPEHIREGRYGDWLANNVDWALSRERYWGTPLPLWRCDTCDEITAVSSLADLGRRAGTDLSDLDPHRPFVDEVTFGCPACGDATAGADGPTATGRGGGTARRVPEVIDAWYDSGSMPFAQFGYPHAAGSAEAFDAHFPADFICEAIDQTRGWFYSLMAVSNLLFEENSYRTVLVLGHIVDADGRKMSKSVGNVLNPWDVVASHGADALRWLMLTDGSPWVNRRVGEGPLDEVVRKILLTLWNTHYFFMTYARLDDWTPETSRAPGVGERDVMDRWVLADLADTVAIVDAALETYDTTTAGRRLAAFVDDLSNWYVRRSRRRFWAPEDAPGKDAAFATLHECLVTVAALLAPFTPFIADELYEQLVFDVDTGAPESVHLLDFPRPDEDAVDDDLRTAMAAARVVTELGRRARNDAQIPVRQPLAQALVTLPDEARAHWPAVAAVVAEELNVKELSVPESSEETVSFRLKPNFRALGPDFGKRTPVVARAIEAADAGGLAALLRADGAAQIDVNGDSVTVTSEQVTVLEESRTGWQVTSDGAYSVALDLTIDETLRREGLARELVRALNDLRKRRDFRLDQRIAVELAVDGDLAAAVREHAETVAAEVLATRFARGDAEGGERLEVGGFDALVRVEPAT